MASVDSALFSDVFGPELWLFDDETLHKRDAIRIIGDDHFNAFGAQKIFVTTKIRVFTHNHSRDTELDDRARTHHARAKGCIKCGVSIGLLPPRFAQRIHFAMRNRIALLHTLIASLGNHVAAARED